MNKQAALNIILAQVASDGGKGIVELLNNLPSNLYSKAEKVWSAGYAAKDELLERACLIVARHHDAGIRFFVTEDKQGIAAYIIYFDIKEGGKRWQASFHSFNKKRWSKWVKPSVASRGNWDHKNSRETCLHMAWYCL